MMEHASAPLTQSSPTPPETLFFQRPRCSSVDGEIVVAAVGDRCG
jgi:hypothetical protein